jgi:hypothetical protein
MPNGPGQCDYKCKALNNPNPSAEPFKALGLSHSGLCTISSRKDILTQCLSSQPCPHELERVGVAGDGGN